MEDLKTFAERIEWARQSKGLTLEQLGAICGNTKAAAKKWVSGAGQPSAAKFNKLARALDVTAEWLITGHDTRTNRPQPTQQKIPDTMLPIIGSVQAGVFQPALQYDGDWERVPFITPSGYNSKDFYILRVVGDSMDAHYPDGTMIVCCKLRAYNGALVEGRHIIVERRDEYSDGSEATVKELVHDIANSQWLLMPKSSNPKYKPIPIPNGNGDILDFAGRDDLSITGVVYAKYELNRNF
ncbi:LexA family protein [Terasakiella pusilla]|uniref:LexA family protein n=1 Tax=Terasakiella pusilla TaxID=64973 RepID=UPI003AA803D0